MCRNNGSISSVYEVEARKDWRKLADDNTTLSQHHYALSKTTSLAFVVKLRCWPTKLIHIDFKMR